MPPFGDPTGTVIVDHAPVAPIRQSAQEPLVPGITPTPPKAGGFGGSGVISPEPQTQPLEPPNAPERPEDAPRSTISPDTTTTPPVAETAQPGTAPTAERVSSNLRRIFAREKAAEESFNKSLSSAIEEKLPPHEPIVTETDPELTGGGLRQSLRTMKGSPLVPSTTERGFFEKPEGATDGQSEAMRTTAVKFQAANSSGVEVPALEQILARKVIENPFFQTWGDDEIRDAMDTLLYSAASPKVLTNPELLEEIAKESDTRKLKEKMEGDSGLMQAVDSAASNFSDAAGLIGKVIDAVGVEGDFSKNVDMFEEANARIIAERNETSIFNARNLFQKTFGAVRFAGELMILKKVSPGRVPAILEKLPASLQKAVIAAEETGKLFFKHSVVSSLAHGATSEEALIEGLKSGAAGAILGPLGAIPAKLKVLSVPATMAVVKEVTRLSGGSPEDQSNAMLTVAGLELFGLLKVGLKRFTPSGQELAKLTAKAKTLIANNPKYKNLKPAQIARMTQQIAEAATKAVAKEYKASKGKAGKTLGVTPNASEKDILYAWYKAAANASVAGEALGSKSKLSDINEAGRLLAGKGKVGNTPNLESVAEAVVAKQASLAADGAIKSKNAFWQDARSQILQQKQALKDGAKPKGPAKVKGPGKKLIGAGHAEARTQGLLDSKGNPTEAYRRLAVEVTGVRSMAKMTPEQANTFIKAVKEFRKPFTAALFPEAHKQSKTGAVPTDSLTKAEATVLNKKAGKAARQLEAHINRQGALPTEPGLRKAMLRVHAETAAKMNKAARDPGLDGSDGERRTKSVIPKLSSSRNALDAASTATGTNISKDYNDTQNLASRATNSTTKEVKKIYKDATGESLGRLGFFPVEDAAINDFLSETNPAARKAKFDKIGGKSTARQARSKAVAKATADLLEGPAANATREARFRIWDLKAELDPKNADTYAPPDVPKADRAKVLAAGRKANAAGDLGKWVSGEKWGTRELYFMTQKAPESLADLIFSTGKAETLNIGDPFEVGTEPKFTPSAANTRKGDAKPVQNVSVIDAVLRHYTNMRVFNATMESRKAMWKGVQDAKLSPGDVKIMKDFMRSAMGAHKNTALLTKGVQKLQRGFWRSYFATPTKAAWFAVRNSAQNIAFGMTHLHPVRSAAALVRAARPSKRAPDFGKFYAETFAGDMSQRRAHRRFVMQEDGLIGPAKKLGGKVRTLGNQITSVLDWAGQSAGLTDEANRIVPATAAYQEAWDAAMAYKAGKMSFGKLSNRLLLETLPEGQQTELFQSLANGPATAFAARLASIKVENLHFRYSPAGRSAVEQSPGARSAVGVVTYTRGVVELVAQSGVKPIIRGVKAGNGRQVMQGLRTLGALVAGTWAANETVHAITGKSAYDIIDMTTQYTPVGPGAEAVRKLLDKTSNISENRESRTPAESAEKLAEAAIDAGAIFIPFADSVISAYESVNDVKGVRLYRLGKKAVLDAFEKEHGIKFNPANRETREWIQNSIFGGVDPEPLKDTVDPRDAKLRTSLRGGLKSSDLRTKMR